MTPHEIIQAALERNPSRTYCLIRGFQSWTPPISAPRHGVRVELDCGHRHAVVSEEEDPDYTVLVRFLNSWADKHVDKGECTNFRIVRTIFGSRE